MATGTGVSERLP